jgi:hypothetical protein
MASVAGSATEVDLLVAILESEKIQPKTKDFYVHYIVESIKLFGDLSVIMNNPEDFYDKLLKYAADTEGRKYATLSDNTINAYVSSIMSLFIHNSINSGLLWDRWVAIRTRVREPIDARVKQNVPLSSVTFEEVVRVRDSLSVGYDKLLLAMYTMIPPLRSDFACVSLSKDDRVGETHINMSTGIMTIPNYKTSGKYGTLAVQLPDELLAIIYETTDGLWLFGPKTDGAYNKWANRALHRLFGADVSLTTLRHLFISTLDITNMTESEREEIARSMGHSVMQQSRYRWV